MSTPQSLPDQPNFEQLKKQAKDRVKDARAKKEKLSLKEAQREVAQSYGFKSWAALRTHLDTLDLAGQLKTAIDTEEVERARALLQAHPELHRAKMGYGGDGPLTWVAECRGATPPSEKRLAIAKLMLELGSDVHQGNDGPLMRACMNDGRLPMAELLVQHGADVNAQWHNFYPIVCTPCECLAPKMLEWLLKHGANPNVASSKYGYPLDMAVGTYGRSPAQHACVELLVCAGAQGKCQALASLPIHRGRLDLLAHELDRDSSLLSRHFPEFEYGGTAHRGLNLKGTTLLHVAAEFCEADAARLLLERGADPNTHALIGEAGVGGQTPIFHAVTQYDGLGLEVTQLLIEAGADLRVRCKIRGRYDDEKATHEVTPLGYAARFPYGQLRNRKCLDLLVAHNAPAGDVYAAARSGRVEELKELLKAGADPNLCGPDADTSVGAALAEDHREAVQVLIDAGAVVGLAEACSLGLAERVEALLRADPARVKECFGERRWTPVFFAAVANQVEVLNVLWKFHASLTAKDQHQEFSPLHRAVEHGCVEAVEWLLEHGAPVGARSSIGQTPMEVATRIQAPKRIVELLSRTGA